MIHLSGSRVVFFFWVGFDEPWRDLSMNADVVWPPSAFRDGPPPPLRCMVQPSSARRARVDGRAVCRRARRSEGART